MRTAETTQMARQHIFAVNGSPDFLDLLRELLQDERYNVTTTNFVPATFAQIDALQPANSAPGMMAEQGPVEVQHAARAFNAMQTRIRDHLQERARILAWVVAGAPAD